MVPPLAKLPAHCKTVFVFLSDRTNLGEAMRQETTSPIVLAQARTSEGVAFQLRRDSKGVLEVPALANVLISIHVGALRR